jgi:hypothetical protein
VDADVNTDADAHDTVVDADANVNALPLFSYAITIVMEGNFFSLQDWKKIFEKQYHKILLPSPFYSRQHLRKFRIFLDVVAKRRGGSKRRRFRIGKKYSKNNIITSYQ